MKKESGFSLLEVLVVLVITSVALSWYLYFFSEVNFMRFSARTTIKNLDQSYKDLLLFLKNFSSEEPTKETKIQKIGDKGPYHIRIRLKGVLWNFYYIPENEIGIKRTPPPPDLMKIFQGLKDKNPVLPFPFGH